MKSPHLHLLWGGGGIPAAPVVTGAVASKAIALVAPTRSTSCKAPKPLLGHKMEHASIGWTLSQP